MKLRQARKIWNKQIKAGLIPHTPGVWCYMPAYVFSREHTKVAAFRRLARVGEGPWNLDHWR